MVIVVVAGSDTTPLDKWCLELKKTDLREVEKAMLAIAMG